MSKRGGRARSRVVTSQAPDLLDDLPPPLIKETPHPVPKPIPAIPKARRLTRRNQVAHLSASNINIDDIGIVRAVSSTPTQSDMQSKYSSENNLSRHVYTQNEVEDLPNKLEKEISELHTSIARTLITNSEILNQSSAILEDISQKVNNFQEKSTLKNAVNEPSYKKLSSISSEHKYNQTTIYNKKKVIAQFQIILEKMEIPEDWKITLNKTKFEIDNLKHLQSVLTKATDALDEKNTPSELVGLLVAKERRTNINDLLGSFTNNFVNFFKDLLSKPVAIEDAARIAGKIVNIPREDASQEPRKFSQDVSSHTILLAIYSYSKVIIWIRKRNPTAYEQLIQHFHSASKIYSKELILEVVEKATDSIKAIKKQVKPNEFFGAGKYMKDVDATKIWEYLQNASNIIFDMISREKVILKEYWNVKDEEILNDLVSPDIYSKIEAMWDLAAQYDKFFILRGTSLNNNVLETRNLPLAPLIESLQNKWEKYLKSQVKLIKAEKFNTNKTTVFSPFKHFPAFIVHLMHRGTSYDQEFITDAFEKLFKTLEKWLVENVVPKFEERKRERLIVVNIHYVISKLETRESINKNEEMMKILQNEKEFMSMHINLLLQELIGNMWKNEINFFGKITMWMIDCGLPPEVVTFQPTHTDEKFKELALGMEKNFSSNYKNCLEIINNKIKYPELKKLVTESLSPFILEKWNKWNELALSCYGIGVTPTISAVKALLYPEK